MGYLPDLALVGSFIFFFLFVGMRKGCAPGKARHVFELLIIGTLVMGFYAVKAMKSAANSPPQQQQKQPSLDFDKPIFLAPGSLICPTAHELDAAIADAQNECISSVGWNPVAVIAVVGVFPPHVQVRRLGLDHIAEGWVLSYSLRNIPAPPKD
jgi:hypothetical protein